MSNTLIESYVGVMPSPVSKSFRPWADDAARAVIELCPLERETVYYFSQDGNDSTGDGSEATPYKTIAKAQAVHDAWTEDAGGLRLRFNRGDEWNEGAGLVISKKYVTIDAYGTGVAPLFNWFTGKISAASNFSQAGGTDRWTSGLDEPGWLREQGRRLTPYRYVDSTAAVESTPRSFYWASDTLHVNAGTDVDPNDFAYEFTPVDGDDVSGIEFEEGASFGRVHGIRCDGWGLNGNLEQTYGIKSGATGKDIFAATDCETYYNMRHNYGHNSTSVGSGGLTVWVNHKAGFTDEQSGTIFIAFAGLGGQEALTIGNQIVGGPLAKDDRTNAEGLGLYAHCASTNTVGLMAFVDTRYDNDAEFAVSEPSLVAAVSTPAADRIEDARAIIYGDVFRRGKDECLLKITPGMARVNGHYEIVAQDVGQQALALYDAGGWMVNCYVQLDMVNVTQTFFAFFHTNTASDPKIWFNHIHFIRNNHSRLLLDRENLNGSQAAKLAGTEFHFNVYTATADSDGNQIGVGLLNDTDAMQYNGFYQIDDPANGEGYGDSTSPVELPNVPGREQKIYQPTDLVFTSDAAKAKAKALKVEVDIDGRLRDPDIVTIGPRAAQELTGFGRVFDDENDADLVQAYRDFRIEIIDNKAYRLDD